MRFWKNYSGALLAGFAWMATAMAMLALRDGSGALTMLWVPSAVAVGALFGARPAERTRVVAALALANLATNFWYGLGLVPTIGFAFANLSQPVVTAAIAHRIIANRRLTALSQWNLLGLLGAVLLGALTSSLLALPFLNDRSLVQFTWWLFSTALGAAVGAPVFVYLRWALHLRRSDGGLGFRKLPLDYIASLGGFLALAWWALGSNQFLPASLVFAALVFAAVRFGLLGACGAVFAFGLAATLRSIGGLPPAGFIDLEPFAAGLVLQAYMLLMLATALPLASLLTARDRLALSLRVRNARMHENLELLRMAEDIARIGRWRYYPRTGKQDWSRGLFLINGLDPALGRDPGNLRPLLPDGGDELFGQLAHHSNDRAPYNFEYRIRTAQGDERILKMQASNEFDEDGELVCMFGVVIDVTDHHRREEQLDKERTRAMRLAAEAQYLAQTDPLTGLANRRRTFAQLDKYVLPCTEGAQELAVIAFDIDRFKQVNDRFGHQVGDEVIQRVAEIARGEARASDLIGRIGGEEFVWLLPGAGIEVARSAALRLRRAIERGSGVNGLPAVTASIGLAQWRDGDDAASLLGRADAGLYQAKEAGRNKVKQAA